MQKYIHTTCWIPLLLLFAWNFRADHFLSHNHLGVHSWKKTSLSQQLLFSCSFLPRNRILWVFPTEFTFLLTLLSCSARLFSNHMLRFHEFVASVSFPGDTISQWSPCSSGSYHLSCAPLCCSLRLNYCYVLQMCLLGLGSPQYVNLCILTTSIQ